MQNQPISAAEVAQAVRAWVPDAVEVRLAPAEVSDGTGKVCVNSTWVAFFASGGAWIEDVTLPVSEMLLRVLSALPGRVRTCSQVFDVAAAGWEPRAPMLSVLPLAASPVAEALAADAYRVAQLEAQRHELEDDAEPPLAVAVPDPAADFARSVRDGFVTPVDWGDDPQPAPARDVTDVPVQDGAL